jgi:AraC family transcriptional activator of pobA
LFLTEYLFGTFIFLFLQLKIMPISSMQSINNQNDNIIPEISSRELDFDIISFKNFFKDKNFKDTQRYTVADRNMILIITSGLGKHIVDFKSHQFTNGSLIFIAQGQVHKFDYKPGNSGYILFFSDTFLNSRLNTLSQSWLFNYHVDPLNIQVNAKMREHFFDIIEKIYQEFRSNNTFAKNEVIKTLLYLLLVRSERIKRELISKDALNRSDLIFEFIKVAEKHYSESRNADYFAKLLNISYKHLNNVCKQALNKTAKTFIDEYIMLIAKRYLVCYDMSVRQISDATGFDEPTNFVKYFRKHTGMSPGQFKAKY